ncbi:MAG: hypothetical protein H6Q25_1472 [Bacteroidetes bacterium]|nr:hypothetical protein [Bacteroidota bacterium]
MKKITLFLLALFCLIGVQAKTITFISTKQAIMIPPQKEISQNYFKIEFVIGQNNSWVNFKCDYPSNNLMNLRGVYTIVQTKKVNGTDYYTVINTNGIYFSISVDVEAITISMVGTNILYVFYLSNAY